MTSFVVTEGTGKPSVKIIAKKNHDVIATTEIHIDHDEVGPSDSCVKPKNDTIKRMIRCLVSHDTRSSCSQRLTSTVYAASLLSKAAEAGVSDEEQSSDKAQLTIGQADLDKLTLVVERECRNLYVRTMRTTKSIYGVNVHTHFTSSKDKGVPVKQLVCKDLTSSKILIKGPYAPNPGRAVAAMEADLVQKVTTRDTHSRLTDTDYAKWLIDPLTKAVDGEDGVEPRMPVGTWATVNVGVVTREEAERRANGTDVGCPGEYTHRWPGRA